MGKHQSTVVLFALLASPLVAGMTCYNYTCFEGDESQLLLNTCVFFSKSKSTFYLNPCQPDSNLTYCPPIDTPGNSTCLPLGPSDAESAFPGEPCDGDLMCYEGGYCESGICMANSTAESCTAPYDCNQGLTCLPVPQKENEFHCGLQKAVGNACVSDYDCVNNAGCNNGVCTYYFRKQEGEAVTDCAYSNEYEPSLFNVSYMCESAMCYNGNCLRPLNLTSQDEPVPCTNNTNCVNRFYADEYWDLGVGSECMCGYNSNGSAFCQPLPGDVPGLQYFNKLQLWLNSTVVGKCHSWRRFSLPCIKLYWSAHDYAELQYFAYRYWYYAQITNMDKCALAIYASEYSAALEAFESSASALSVAFLAVVLT